MSIRLIVEVLDHWKDLGLTVGERDDLVVIAENCNDSSRETFGPIHEDYILRRANKSAKSWRTAIGRLMQKDALEYAIHNGREMRGHPGRHAVYRIPILCPEHPHDGWRGYCTRPERVTSQVTQLGGEDKETGPLTEDPINAMGPPSEGPSTGMGPLSEVNGSSDRGEWVRQQRTPTPLSPQLPPLSLAEQVVRNSGVVAEDERETFISWLKDKHQIRGLGWWKTVSPNDLAEHAADWRAQLTTASAAPVMPAWCGKCGDGNPAARFNVKFRFLDDRQCPDCHPNTCRSKTA